ncbi:MAG TPA: hypothetical protein VII41_04115, partial [Steroidobacteraceae bacterium]
ARDGAGDALKIAFFPPHQGRHSAREPALVFAGRAHPFAKPAKGWGAQSLLKVGGTKPAQFGPLTTGNWQLATGN